MDSGSAASSLGDSLSPLEFLSFSNIKSFQVFDNNMKGQPAMRFALSSSSYQLVIDPSAGCIRLYDEASKSYIATWLKTS